MIPSFVEHSDKRYRVVRELGRGHSGTVYLAEDPQGTEVAIKCLSSQSNETTLQRLRQEFLILRSLQHPNIAQPTDFGFDKNLGRYFFVAEYVRGASLDAACSESEAIDGAIRLFAQGLRALDYMHRRGVYHCDLKPKNILVTPEGELKIIDFDVAVRGTPSIGGTPAYCAPELLFGERPLPDARSDLFSFGATFYYCLTRRKPFLANSLPELAVAHGSQRPPLPSELNPRLGTAWDGLLIGMLQSDPSQRYATAASALQQLHPLLGEKKTIISEEDIAYRLRQHGVPIGKDALLRRATGFLEGPTLENSGPRIAWITGEPGLGGSYMAAEIRAAAQVRGLPCFTHDSRHPAYPTQAPFVWILDDLAALRRDGARSAELAAKLRAALLEARESPSWIFCGGFSSEADLAEELRPLLQNPELRLELRAWSDAEARAWLAGIFQSEELPPYLVSELRRASAGNPKRLAHWLEAYLRRGLILDPQGIWRQDLFHPSLAFQREFAEDGSPDEIQRRHDRLAEAGGDPEQIRYHRARGSEPLAAARALAESGDEYARRALWQSAQECYTKAYQRTPAEDTERRFQYSIDQGKCLVQRGLLDEAHHFFSGLLKTFQSEKQKNRLFLAKICERLGLLETKRGRIDRAREYFVSGVRCLEPGREPLEQYLGLKNFLAGLDLAEGKVEAAVRSYRESFAAAESLPWERRRVLTNNDLGAALLKQGNIEGAVAHWEALLPDLEKREDRKPLVRCLFQIGNAHSSRGSRELALEFLEKARRAGQDMQNFEMELRIFNALANELKESDPQRALEMYERGLDAAFQTPDVFSTAVLFLNMGHLLAELRQSAQARYCLSQGIQSLSSLPTQESHGPMLREACLELEKLGQELQRGEP